jgi:hypothetical protein
MRRIALAFGMALLLLPLAADGAASPPAQALDRQRRTVVDHPSTAPHSETAS